MYDRRVLRSLKLFKCNIFLQMKIKRKQKSSPVWNLFRITFHLNMLVQLDCNILTYTYDYMRHISNLLQHSFLFHFMAWLCVWKNVNKNIFHATVYCSIYFISYFQKGISLYLSTKCTKTRINLYVSGLKKKLLCWNSN